MRRQSLPWESSPPNAAQKNNYTKLATTWEGLRQNKGLWAQRREQFEFEGPGKASYGFIFALSFETFVLFGLLVDSIVRSQAGLTSFIEQLIGRVCSRSLLGLLKGWMSTKWPLKLLTGAILAWRSRHCRHLGGVGWRGRECHLT